MTEARPIVRSCFVLLPLCAIAVFGQCGDRATAATAPQEPTPAPRRAEGPAGEQVRLLVSGNLEGHLEPCGCASGQLGGLPRRMQYIGEQHGTDLFLEGGNLLGGKTELDVQKAYTALNVLFQMQQPYDALGIGANDLALTGEAADEWNALLGSMAPAIASDLVSTRPDWPAKPFVEKVVRGTKVRIGSFARALPPVAAGKQPDTERLEPAAAWQRALAGADDAALRVLLYHGPDASARTDVPGLRPAPDLVICFDDSYTEPAAHPEVVGTVPIVYPGTRGRVLLDLTLGRGESGPHLGYSLVPLPASKTLPGGGGDPDVRQALLQHRDQVAQSGLLARMARQLPTANGASYVGGKACALCHQTAAEAWAKSKHAHAWQALVDGENDPKRYGWPVTKYPDCVACHAVGYREQTGFVDAATTPTLANVDCERCHGAGSAHGEDPAAHRLGLIGGVQASVLCVQCHDFDQSPTFVYGDKWPLIQHGREPDQKK